MPAPVRPETAGMPLAIKTYLTYVAVFCLAALYGCGRQDPADVERYYTNPVFTFTDNITPYFHEGTYYFLSGHGDKITLYVTRDPTTLSEAEPHMVFDVRERTGLMHIWHPYLSNIGGKWYIHFSGDTGNTDDHQIYVLVNPADDPREGEFTMAGRVSTDPGNNWAIHSCVFEYRGELYMLWSGWESRRVFAETQCIFIARMADPWTLSSERVMISRPLLEWERQWMSPQGQRSAYPIYVNEAPWFFNSPDGKYVYIFYSASAMWTQFMTVGELSAFKGSDLLDPQSWMKKPEPVFSRNLADGVLGPGYPRILPSPDGTEHYLFYMAGSTSHPNRRTVRMQPVGFTDDGRPVLGEPVAEYTPLKKPSGL